MFDLSQKPHRTKLGFANLWVTKGLGTAMALFVLASVSVCLAQALPAGTSPAPAIVLKSGAEKESPPSAASEAAVPGAASTTTPSAPPVIRKVGPDSFYMRDAKGNLILVPDLTFEELERLLQLDRKLAQPSQPPRFALQELSITGEVKARQAMLDARFQVWLRDGDWVRVPLGFPDAALREGVKHQGAGEVVVEYDATAGYVAWVRNKASESITVSLPLLIAVGENAGQSELPLRSTRAATARIDIRVDTPDAVPSNSAVTARPLDRSTTSLTLVGLDENSKLEWKSPSASGRLPLYDVVSNIVVRIEGPTRWSTETRLRIASPLGPVDKFLIRLPVGAKLSPTMQSGVRISLVAPPNPKKANEGDLCEVRLEREMTAEEVRVLTITETPGAAESSLAEMGGFEVLGAAQHSGQIDLVTDGDWYVRFSEGANIRQVDELPESAKRNRVYARFQFSRQPYSLGVRAQKRTTVVSYEPTYIFFVGANAVRLETRMRCQIRGGTARSLELDMGDWNVDSSTMEPAGLFDENAFDPTMKQPLSLVLAKPAGGEMEFTIRASQSFPADSDRIKFTLPRPRGSVVAPAAVVVVPDDNVSLETMASDLVSLTAENSQPPAKLPPRVQAPLVFRENGDGTAPVFAARRRIQLRTMRTRVDSTITAGASELELIQRFTYQVAYEGIERLEFTGSREAFTNVALTLEPEGANLSIFPMSVEGIEGDRMSAVVTLPPPARIGSLVVSAKRKIPLGGVSGEHRKLIDVPLLVPHNSGENREAEHSLRIETRDSVDCELRKSDWKSQVGVGNGRTKHVAALASAPQSVVPLLLNFTAMAETGTLVEMAWVQCQLLAGQRYDRAVFRLSTLDPAVLLRLPDHAFPESIEVLLDGKRQAFSHVTPGVIQVDLPPITRAQERVLEVGYAAERLPSSISRTLSLPRIERARWTRRTWVQVLLPPSEHLFAHSGPITSDLQWQWRGYFWEQLGRIDERVFEKASGATSQPELSSELNRYVFSSFAVLPEIELKTVSRRNLVLWGGGVLLVLGFLWIYLPSIRSVPLALGLGLTLIAFVAWQPTLAALGIQASLVGIVLTTLAVLLQAFVVRRGERRQGLHGRWNAPPSLVAPPPMGSRERKDGSSQQTTMAGPVIVAMGASQSES